LQRIWPDLVDFHRNVIYLRNTKGDTDHAIPMNVRTRETLRVLVSKAQAKGYSYIFTNKATGKPYTSLKTAWKTACKQAGITNLRIHDLRHTFGTRAADAGAPLRAIQDVMGHSSIAMTERYAHATDEGKRRVVEAAGLKRAVVVKMASKKAVGE
jgi:integrase